MNRPIEYYAMPDIPDDVILDRAAHASRMLAEELPDDPPLVPENSLKRLRSLPSTWRVHAWVVRCAGRIAADAYLGWTEGESNQEAAYIDITVEPELRGAGLGARLTALAVAKAEAAGRPLIFVESSSRLPAGERFLERAGFTAALRNRLNQLEIARLDRRLMASWLAQGTARGHDYEIEVWDGPVPDNRLAAFAALADVMNGEPHGDLEVEDTKHTPEMIRELDTMTFANGTRRLIACARHCPSGELVGFSELSWHPMRAAIVSQFGTGVVTEHRGHGLGRWLKAVNAMALLQANPGARVIRTRNADSNAPMLRINDEMGFVPFMATTEWQARAPAVLQRLKAGAAPSHRRPVAAAI